MTAKLLQISAYQRRAPADRFHGDHMTEMLAKALEIAFAEDDGFATRTQETY